MSARELLSSSTLDSESFKVYCYKIVPCAKKFGHDWSECPFAHEGEKATRRCPALYRYSSIVCPEIRQSKACPRGEVCPYSHSIFEYWMHPARFRAQLCSFGTDCNRRICFFAHTQEQLRIPSEPVVADALAARAPYLQGRVSPETRFALYPEQVPVLVPVQGRLMPGQQQPQLLNPADMEAGVVPQVPQVVYVPAAGGPQGMALAAGPGTAGGAVRGQQWAAAGGGNMVFMPAGQPGTGGMGYYITTPAGGSSGGAAAGSGQEYAAPVMVSPSMQLVGGGYGSAQQVQLMAAVPGDGSSMQPYAAGSMAGGAVTYAPMYASGAVGMTMQQWTAAPQQQLPQHQHQQVPPVPPPPPLQLVQVPDTAGDAARQQEGSILTPGARMGGAGSLAGSSRGQLESPYGMMARGPGLVTQGVHHASAGGLEQAGTGGVEDIAQQMAGWRIQ